MVKFVQNFFAKFSKSVSVPNTKDSPTLTIKKIKEEKGKSMQRLNK